MRPRTIRPTIRLAMVQYNKGCLNRKPFACDLHGKFYFHELLDESLKWNHILETDEVEFADEEHKAFEATTSDSQSWKPFQALRLNKFRTSFVEFSVSFAWD